MGLYGSCVGCVLILFLGAHRLAHGQESKVPSGELTLRESGLLASPTEAMLSVPLWNRKMCVFTYTAGSVSLYDFSAKREVFRLSLNLGAVEHVELCSKEQFLLIGFTEGHVVVFDMKSQKIVFRMRTHSSHGGDCLFVPNSNCIVVAGEDYDENKDFICTAKLIDWKSKKVVAQFPSSLSVIQCIGVSPDGKRILTAGGGRTKMKGIITPYDCVIRLWDLNTKVGLGKLVGHDGTITNVRFSNDGKFVLSSARDGTVRYWDLAQFREILRMDMKEKMNVRDGGLAISPNGANVLVATGAKVHVLDLTQKKKLTSIEHPHMVSKVGFFSDSSAFSACFRGTVHLIDLQKPGEAKTGQDP